MMALVNAVDDFGERQREEESNGAHMLSWRFDGLSATIIVLMRRVK
jgi:hypothetical protein